MRVLPALSGRGLFRLEGHCDQGRDPAAVPEDPVEGFLQTFMKAPADAGIIHQNVDGSVITVIDLRLPENSSHHMGK